MCGDLERGELFDLGSRGHRRGNEQIHLSQADNRPGEPKSDKAVRVNDGVRRLDLYGYLVPYQSDLNVNTF